MPRILTLRRRAFFFAMRLRFCRMSIMASRMLLPSLARVLLLWFRHRLPALWCCNQTLEHCMNADWTAGSFSRAARNGNAALDRSTAVSDWSSSRDRGP